MGAQKKQIFNYEMNRNAELSLVTSASARIEILSRIDHSSLVNVSILELSIPLHKKTILHHVNLIERSGLIEGFYIGNVYYWRKNEANSGDWDKIRWTFDSLR